jgi:carbon monoxide dehydrogenase subunit G
MDFSGEYRIPAPAERVWEALNDVEVLKACIPGCRELERSAENAFSTVVATKVGPISAVFKGRVTLSDLDPPRGYTLSGEGQGGAAGFARMTARVALAEDGAETALRYDAKAEIGGKLASVGSRLVQSVAKKNADDFFTAFAARLGGAAVEPPLAAAASVQAGPPETPTGAPAKPARVALPAWVIALVAGGLGVVLGFVLGRL